MVYIVIHLNPTFLITKMKVTNYIIILRLLHIYYLIIYYHHISLYTIREEKWEIPTADQEQLERYRSYADLARGAKRSSRVGLLHASTLGRLGVNYLSEIDDTYQSSTSIPIPELVEYGTTPSSSPRMQPVGLGDQHSGDGANGSAAGIGSGNGDSNSDSDFDYDIDDLIDLSPPPLLIRDERIARDHPFQVNHNKNHDADTNGKHNHNNDKHNHINDDFIDVDPKTLLNYPLVKVALAVHRIHVTNPSSILLHESNHSPKHTPDIPV